MFELSVAPRSTSNRALVTVLVLLTGLWAPTALADDAEQDLFNPAYVATFGFGEYTIGGRSVQAYRVPVAFTLRDPEERDWGLDLTTPFSFGVHSLSVEGEEESLFARVKTATVAPGLEFKIPLRYGWLLRPYVEVGYVAALSGDQDYWTWAAGARAGIDLPRGSVVTRLGGGLTVAGSEQLPEEISDHFTELELGAEVRFPAGFELAGGAANLGIYVIGRWFNGLEFAVPNADPISVSLQGEVGFNLATDPPWQLFGLDMPSLGLGYRFGDGLSGVRLSFGFPF